MNDLRQFHPGAVLLIAALCVRALVPEGFMPARGHLVELCTEHGLQQLLVDAATGEVLGEEDGGGASACPWSLMLPTLAPPVPPAAAALVIQGPGIPLRSSPPRLAPNGPVLPPARAPPRLI